MLKYLRNTDYGVMIRTVWRLEAGHHRDLVLVYVGLGFANIFVNVYPLFIGRIVRIATEGGPQLVPHLYLWLGLLLLNAGAFWVFNGPARYLERSVAFRVRTRLTDELYSRITSMPWSWHQDHHSGNTLNRMNYATNAVYEFTEGHFLWFEMVTRLAGSLAFLLYASPLAGLVFIVSMPLLVILMQRFNKALMAISKRQNAAEHQVTAGLIDYLGNISTVLTLRLQQVSRSEIMRRLANVWTTQHRQIVLVEAKWCIFVMSMEIAGAASILLYVLWHRNDAPAVMAGALATLFQYLRMINIAVRSMADRQQGLMAQRVNIDGVAEIMNSPPPAMGETGSVLAGWQRAEIGGLRFRYRDEQSRIHSLDGIDLTLRRGQRIALVGESGSGKSTLLRLLRGLHEPEAASLEVDGVAMPFALLAEITTLVPQEPEIFENTLRYNITCGIADESGLDEALSMASLEPVIAPLALGLDTDIREKGVNLSGGQKQRLALARGLFAAKDSSLLLLDEPTSSLDPVTEAIVYDRIFTRLPDTCIVSSVHRLHLLPRFDHVYVMESGKVVEHGTFDALLEAKGRLYAMYLAQQREAEMDDG
jgi:ABC-type multidrug transport system fused ATPase/permease subunit